MLAYNKQDALRLLDDPRYTYELERSGNTLIRATVSKVDGSGPDLIVERRANSRARVFWNHLAGDIDQIWCWETWSYEAAQLGDFLKGQADGYIQSFGLDKLQKYAGIGKLSSFSDYVSALHASGYDVRIIARLDKLNG